MWEIDRKKCLRCGACVGVCPELALDLKDNGIEHDREKCTECGICQKVCPSGSIRVERSG